VSRPLTLNVLIKICAHISYERTLVTSSDIRLHNCRKPSRIRLERFEGVVASTVFFDPQSVALGSTVHGSSACQRASLSLNCVSPHHKAFTKLAIRESNEGRIRRFHQPLVQRSVPTAWRIVLLHWFTLPSAALRSRQGD
jgi:hypothetical protein